jgi:hypothetical protein
MKNMTGEKACVHHSHCITNTPPSAEVPLTPPQPLDDASAPLPTCLNC